MTTTALVLQTALVPVVEDAVAARLCEIINLHSEVGSHLKMSLEKAMRIGDLLIEQKATLKHGEFINWVKGNLPFTDRTARNYMMLSRQRGELKTETLSDLSVTGGYQMLRAPLSALIEDKRNTKREEQRQQIEYAKAHPEEVPVGEISYYVTPGGWKGRKTITGELNGFPFVKTDCIDPNYLMLEDAESPFMLKHELEQVIYGLHGVELDLNRCLKKYKDQIENAYWTDWSRGICTTRPELTQALSDIALMLKKFSKHFGKPGFGFEYSKFEGIVEANNNPPKVETNATV